MSNKIIEVQDISINVTNINEKDYICISDIAKTNEIGLYSKLGKYGGTYAHKDIAFEFASAISPVFKLYLIKKI